MLWWPQPPLVKFNEATVLKPFAQKPKVSDNNKGEFVTCNLTSLKGSMTNFILFKSFLAVFGVQEYYTFAAAKVT